jgi:Protein ENHANCED DISEASE RESISTANCE 2, C-terminal
LICVDVSVVFGQFLSKSCRKKNLTDKYQSKQVPIATMKPISTSPIAAISSSPGCEDDTVPCKEVSTESLSDNSYLSSDYENILCRSISDNSMEDHHARTITSLFVRTSSEGSDGAAIVGDGEGSMSSDPIRHMTIANSLARHDSLDDDDSIPIVTIPTPEMKSNIVNNNNYSTSTGTVPLRSRFLTALTPSKKTVVASPAPPEQHTTPARNSSATMSLRLSSSNPMDMRLADVVSIPHPLRLDAWSEGVATTFNVRGMGYNTNLVKVPSAESVFKLLTVDLVRSVHPNFKGMCAHPEERIQTALRKEQGSVSATPSADRELPRFIFAVNLCVPSAKAYCHHCVFYFGLEDINILKDTSTPLGRVAKPFFFGSSDEFRDKTFKLIPRIVEGNFVVRKAVGSKPAVLGSKVKQYYIQNDRYFEIVIDIGSDSIANNIVKLALGYCKTLTVDMMFLLEGHDDSMLPERILGGVEMVHIDFKTKDGLRVCNPMP